MISVTLAVMLQSGKTAAGHRSTSSCNNAVRGPAGRLRNGQIS